MFDQLLRQLKMNRWGLTMLSTVMLVLIVIEKYGDLQVGILTRDPNAVANQPFYYGIASQLGSILWFVVVAIVFFTIALVRQADVDKRYIPFLQYSGLLSLLLGLDDLLMLHEQFFPLVLGVPELLIVMIYMVLIGSLLLFFYRTIRQTEYIYLLLALCLWGFSCCVDGLYFSKYLVEDGAKLLGLLAWTVYYVRFCFRFAQSPESKSIG
jgi:hypothetical protein